MKINTETICEALSISWTTMHGYINEGNKPMKAHTKVHIMSMIEGMISMLIFCSENLDDTKSIRNELNFLWKIVLKL